jgi:hypothetical protein
MANSDAKNSGYLLWRPRFPFFVEMTSMAFELAMRAQLTHFRKTRFSMTDFKRLRGLSRGWIRKFLTIR